MTSLGGLFGSRTDNVVFSTDSESNKVQTKQGTSRYSTAGMATIIVSKIKNPQFVHTFGSFKITIYDKNMKRIASATQDITFTTSPGQIRDVKVSPGSVLIDEQFRLGVSFLPLHDMPKDAKILIELSKALRVECSGSDEYNSKQLNSPLNMTCEGGGELTKITVHNPLSKAYIHED